MNSGDTPGIARIGLAWDGAFLDACGLGEAIGQRADASSPVLILVNLAGRFIGDPSIVAPARVEALIDWIHDRHPVTVNVAASADSSSLWAGNRDVYALADLHGYRFRTDGGCEYDIVDLGEETVDGAFPAGAILHGTPASRAWIDAAVCINLASFAFDEADHYRAGLANLSGALPLVDATLHYRQRRDPGAVIADLLMLRPPDFTIIDGLEPHGWLVASTHAVLADYAAALKAGLDPYDAPLFAEVARVHPLPLDHTIEGPLAPPETAGAPAPIVGRARRAARTHEAVGRTLDAWLQPLDAGIFPPNLPIDAGARDLLRSLTGDGDGKGGAAIATLLNLLAAAAGRSLDVWRMVADKDALVRRIVPLDLDPATLDARDFDDAVRELDSLSPIAASAPERGPGLRWRKAHKAVVFEYGRDLAIPFDRFVAAVDVARAIQFMNDYLGGVLVPVTHDDAGRPVRQVERNLYLPQPNYLALYQGQPIDVTKIEVARYSRDQHRLYWKTIKSGNGSATADDGIVSFDRTGDGTRVTITGKQHFVLPPFWQFFDISLVPEVETALTTHAYQTFFDRTLSNFEALVEGRDIRLGLDPLDDTPHPSIALAARLGRLGEAAEPWLRKLQPEPAMRDADGFVHVVPAA